MKTSKHSESTASSNPKESIPTHEPGACPSIPVEDFCDGPMEAIALHYVRINRVEKNNALRNKKQEDNVRSAELDFMLNLETLIKETAAHPDFIELQGCLEDNKLNQMPAKQVVLRCCCFLMPQYASRHRK